MSELNAGELSQRRNGCRLREFDPSSYEWDEWEILFDTYLTVEGITDDVKKRNLLITALGVQPFKTLISVCKPRKPTEYTYDEIILKLRTNYARVTFASTERIKFFSMKQSVPQSLTDFANQLRDTSTTCKFPGDFYDEALITAFVGGLSNSTVRKHLMQQELTTFEKTLNIANTINSVLVQGANVEQSTSEDNFINKVQERITKTTKGDQKSCFSCGGKDHLRSTCRYKDVECHNCHKQGHIAKVCRSTSDVNRLEVNTIAALPSSEFQMEPAILLSLNIEQINVQFQLDTGSPMTIVSSSVWEQLGQPQLQQVRVLYRSFSGHPIHFKGETIVNVNSHGEKFQLKVLVGDTNQINIIGRDWINYLKLMNARLDNIIDNPGIFNVNSSTTELNQILDGADVGEGGLIAQIQQELPNESLLRAARMATATRKDSTVDLLRQTIADRTNVARQRYERNFNRHTKERYFNQGDKVVVRDFRNSWTKVQWKPGILIQRQGSVLWTVKVEDQIWRRHENQIKPRKWLSNGDIVDDNAEDNADEVIILNTLSSMDTGGKDQDSSISTSTSTSPSESSYSSSGVESPILRRSARIRKPVCRYIEEN